MKLGDKVKVVNTNMLPSRMNIYINHIGYVTLIDNISSNAFTFIGVEFPYQIEESNDNIILDKTAVFIDNNLEIIQ